MNTHWVLYSAKCQAQWLGEVHIYISVTNGGLHPYPKQNITWRRRGLHQPPLTPLCPQIELYIRLETHSCDQTMGS